MNLVQIAERLKGVPKDFLMKEANPNSTSGRYPAYLIYAELKRRVSQEKMFANAEAADNPPQETVAERTMREATPTPTPMAAMQGLKSPRTTYQEEPSGQETMGIPGAVRMFEGGRVSFNDGGRLEEKLKEYKTLRDTGNKYTGVTTKLRELEKEIIALGGQIPGMTGLAGAITRPFFQKTEAEQERAQLDAQLDAQVAGIKELGAQDATFINPEDYYKSTNTKPPKPFTGIGTLSPKVLASQQKEEEEKKEEREVTEEQNTNLLTTQQKEEKVSKDIVAPKQKGIDFENVKKLYNDLSNEIKFELIPEDAVKFKHYEFTDTYEQFTLKRAQMRKNDFLGAMQGKINELKSQNDKDRAQALDMFKLETGLAILSAPGQGKGFGGLLSTVSKALGTPLNQLKQTMQTIRQSEKDLTKSEMQLLQAYDARQEGNIRDFEARKEKAKDSEIAAFNAGAEATLNVIRDNKKITNDGISLLYNTALKITTTDAQIEQANLDRQTKLDVQKISKDAAIKVAEIQTKFRETTNEQTSILEQRKVLMKAFNDIRTKLADTGYDEAKLTVFMKDLQAQIAELDERYRTKFGKVPITGKPTTGSVKNYINIPDLQ